MWDVCGMRRLSATVWPSCSVDCRGESRVRGVRIKSDNRSLQNLGCTAHNVRSPTRRTTTRPDGDRPRDPGQRLPIQEPSAAWSQPSTWSQRSASAGISSSRSGPRQPQLQIARKANEPSACSSAHVEGTCRVGGWTGSVISLWGPAAPWAPGSSSLRRPYGWYGPHGQD